MRKRRLYVYAVYGKKPRAKKWKPLGGSIAMNKRNAFKNSNKPSGLRRRGYIKIKIGKNLGKW
jgi:hypothetical protein